MNGESRTYPDEAELETLLLNRLRDDVDIEFDIEDVRAELAERLKERNIDDKNRPATG